MKNLPFYLEVLGYVIGLLLVYVIIMLLSSYIPR